MGMGGFGQFCSTEFKIRWYTGYGWDLQPHFRDLKSHSGEWDLPGLRGKGSGL